MASNYSIDAAAVTRFQKLGKNLGKLPNKENISETDPARIKSITIFLKAAISSYFIAQVF